MQKEVLCKVTIRQLCFTWNLYKISKNRVAFLRAERYNIHVKKITILHKKERFVMSRFCLPRDIYHGKGCLEELKNLKGKKACLVVGGGSMKRQGFLDRAVNYLKEGGMEVRLIEGVEPDPSVETVMKGAEVMREFEPDWIVAMGGGSPIDAAKAMWVFYEYPEVSFEDIITPFSFPELRQKAKFAAIPSTSGTATEVTAFSVITNYQTGVKYPLADFNITPDVAIVDPDLVSGLPVKQVAYTGMDALTHAVEAYIGNSTTIDTRRDALKAVKLIFENIDIAYEHGDNIQARRNMLHASFYAGCAFTKSYVGYVHAVAHSLGGQYNVPHGLANAILLPLVLREYGSCIDKKLHRLAIAAGLADKNTPDHEAAELFIRAIEEMKERFGIVNIVKEIQETDIPKLAHYADKEANPLYPVPKLMDASELEKFYYMLMSLTPKENTSEAEK